MRFLIVNMDYLKFLIWLYNQHPCLESRPFQEQLRIRNESLFDLADFYSGNLRKLNLEALDLYINNEAMQKAWAREHGFKADKPAPPTQPSPNLWQRMRRVAAGTALHRLKPLFRPLLHFMDKPPSWFYSILAAQIKHYKPDVLINHVLYGISCRFLQEMKPYVRLLVGQHAAMPLSDEKDYTCYDLVVSSFPPTIEYLRQRGIPTAFLRLGFEQEVLSLMKSDSLAPDISFVGSLFDVHSSRLRLLENLCLRFDQLKIWSGGINGLSETSSLHRHYMGQAWGLRMYQILHNSKITINNHGDIAPYANNCRLYEATGVGTLLVTDWKPNLVEMFEPGREIVAYQNNDECAELIQYYLDHEEERKTIALAGQKRTLREHTYFQRMQELVAIVKKHM